MHSSIARMQDLTPPPLGREKADRLRPLPERQPAELLEMLGAALHREEMVARELADDRCEAAAAVGKQDLGRGPGG